MEALEKPKKAKVIKANYILQSKVGTGSVDNNVNQACQKVMDENTVDFSPIAQQYLKNLALAITKIKNKEVNNDQAITMMAQPVMELKANASTFKYNLVGNLANVMLSFLESVKQLDNTVIEIVEAHHKTLNAIVIKKMQGDGGLYGKQLEAELKDACKRYLLKNRSA